jgi:hypothetical protein
MMNETSMQANLRRLRLADIRAYVENRGWTRVKDFRGSLAVFKRGQNLDQLLVPMNPAYEDFAQKMGSAVRKIAESENRTLEAVLEDLFAGKVDILRFRIESQATARGTLPLEQGLSLLDGARRSLLSAACTVLAPKSIFHARLSRTEAEDFVDGCELGQTEEGSYTISVRCPIGANEAQPELEGEVEIPFGRRATRTLVASINSLVEAIDEDRVGVVRSSWASDHMVTANLCEALVKMQPDTGNASLGVQVSWALSVPPPANLARSVTVRSEHFPRIAEIGRELRGPATLEAAHFVAKVDVLCGSDVGPNGERQGEVRLSVYLEDEVIRARALLDSHTYALAAQAHMSNSYVVIRGLLTRGVRLSVLTELQSFEQLPEQLQAFQLPRPLD